MTRTLARTVSWILLLLWAPLPLRAAELKPETLKAWDAYVARAEARIARELESREPFLVSDRLPALERTRAKAALASGAVFMTRVRAADLNERQPDPPGGLIHHWLGVARIPGVRVDDVIRFVQRYDDHARFFEDVAASKVVRREGDFFEAFLKLRRKKIVTVHYNTTHHVWYRRHDAVHTSSRSVATRIAELEHVDTPSEREKAPGKDSGYLWRLNSYWRFAESDGGVTIECESLSLSRGIPFALGWLIRPMVEDVSRESLERTLTSIRNGVVAGSSASAR